jgi:hypothetical protein
LKDKKIPDFLISEFEIQTQMLARVNFIQPDLGEALRFNLTPDSNWDPNIEPVNNYFFFILMSKFIGYLLI